MTTRMLMSALAGAVAVVTVALLGTLFISHRIGSDGATADCSRARRSMAAKCSTPKGSRWAWWNGR
jgi:hypothetical protein